MIGDLTEFYLLLNDPSFFFLNFVQVRGLQIKCVRVGGVEIPNNKRVQYSLQYIHGIGRNNAKKILFDLNVENKITKDLSEEELISIRDEVSKYMIEGDLVSHFLSPCVCVCWNYKRWLSLYLCEVLTNGDCWFLQRRFNALAIRRLKEIQCYRGIRHIQGLPCRGQRTKNNCRTLKGKKVTIAGKKKAPRWGTCNRTE